MIVGGAGYIGSHVVKKLLNLGHDLVVLDNLSTGHRKAINGGEFIQGDIGDRNLLARIFSNRKIDCVMHFAAFSLVGESVMHPLVYNDMARTRKKITPL